MHAFNAFSCGFFFMFVGVCPQSSAPESRSYGYSYPVQSWLRVAEGWAPRVKGNYGSTKGSRTNAATSWRTQRLARHGHAESRTKCCAPALHRPQTLQPSPLRELGRRSATCRASAVHGWGSPSLVRGDTRVASQQKAPPWAVPLWTMRSKLKAPAVAGWDAGDG